MKKCKKLLLVLVCSIVLLLALGISANAQDNDPQLPKSFRFNDGYTAVSLTDFEIYDVYYNPTWDGSLIMEYYAYFNDDIAPYYLQMNFMDANYNVVTTAKLERGWNEVVIPGNSAMFSIVFIDGYYGRQEGSDSYVHCQQKAMYASDGRIAWVYDLQVPVYHAVGWQRGVTLYAMDGRTIEVAPSQVAAYEAVGWYTEPGYYYNFIAGNYYSFVAAGDYVSALYIIDEYAWYCLDSEYEASLDTLLYEALNTLCTSYVNAGDYVSAAQTLSWYGGWLEGSVYSYQANAQYYNTLFYNLFTQGYNAYMKAGNYRAIMDIIMEFDWFVEESGYEYVADTFYYNAFSKEYQRYMNAGDYEGALSFWNWDSDNYYYRWPIAYGAYAYPTAELGYKALKAASDAYVRAKDYNSALELIGEYEWHFDDTAFADEVQQLKNGVMDKWRAAIGCPLAITSATVYYGSDGVARAEITFKNVSYKPVVAFKVDFDTHTIFGDILPGYDYCYADDAYIPSGAERTYTWSLNIVGDKADHLKNVRLTQVVFEDRTDWK